MSSKKTHKPRVFNFRTTDEQIARIQTLAEALDETPSEVMRRLIDSATIATPIVVSNFNQRSDRSVQYGA